MLLSPAQSHHLGGGSADGGGERVEGEGEGHRSALSMAGFAGFLSASNSPPDRVLLTGGISMASDQPR